MNGQYLKSFKMNDTFWNRYETLIREVVLPYQEKALKDELPDTERSHAIENFRLAAEYLQTGKTSSDFYGMVFQDSDVAKWLEAAAYSLALHPDAELSKRVAQLVDLIASAQHDDGYLNTYFTIKEPGRRFTNFHEAHELYCAGHMIEAAVALYIWTEHKKLMSVMLKMVDCFYQHFIVEKNPGLPGHPEIELALMRMYHATNNKKCLELAEHFINLRGTDPEFFLKERANRGWLIEETSPHMNIYYSQMYKPVREQKDAVGHAVRAVYLYTGMADLAKETNDQELVTACEHLFQSIIQKRMYITGGIGSTCIGESFTTDYNLPNDTVYAETCASIGLIFFARKMLDLSPRSIFADTMERALYNCVLAGMQLNGTRFFYVNPLEADPEISGKISTHLHVLPERPKWFGCACCPPNIARLLPSIANYAWSEKNHVLYSHLYIAGELTLEESLMKLSVNTGNYPYTGDITYTFHPMEQFSSDPDKQFTLAVRNPAYSTKTKVLYHDAVIWSAEGTSDTKEGLSIEYKDGYLYLTGHFAEGDSILFQFDMSPFRVFANTAVSADNGKTAFQRGPLVYCAEGIDNNQILFSLEACKNAPITDLPYQKDLLCGILPLETDAVRLKSFDSLYSKNRPEAVPCKLHLIPYYAWSNRGLNQMRVWIPED